MVRDDRKLVVVTGGMTKPVVKIYTAAGAPLAASVWDHGRVVAMGWTSEEDLLIVEDNGQVTVLHAGGPSLTNQMESMSTLPLPFLMSCRREGIADADRL